ncbi:hypothetical protein BDQ17DRAFT_1425586 [Cyathus striatus]|nr:hypothetical protein BDQ17DRAFT_1425586 [Cyathus striatus]
MGRRGSISSYPDYSTIIQESKLKHDYSYTRIAGFDYNYDPADTTYARGMLPPYDPYSDEVVEEVKEQVYDYLRRDDDVGPSRPYTPPPVAGKAVKDFASPRRNYTPPPPGRGQAGGRGRDREGGYATAEGTGHGHGRARGGNRGGGGKRRRASPDYSDYRPQRRGSPDYSPYEELTGAKVAPANATATVGATREFHTSALAAEHAAHGLPERPKTPSSLSKLLFAKKPIITRLSPHPSSPRAPTPVPAAPSEEYLQTSLIPSEHLSDPSSQRKLLVLDLNGTLVFRSPHKKREPRPRKEQGAHDPIEGNVDPTDPYADPTQIRPLRVVHGRPFLMPFREYLFHPSTRSWLDTMVWSSAQPHSVSDMVEKAFADKKDELVAVWARDTLGLREDQYNRKVQTTKDLTKPWENLPLVTSAGAEPAPQAPEQEQRHSARTTLLLDDSPLKAHLQPWNHLCIKEYVGEIRAKDVQIRDAVTRAQRMRSHAAELAASEAAAANEELMSGVEEEVEEVEAMLSEDVSEDETDNSKTVVADSVSPVPTPVSAPTPTSAMEVSNGKKRKREKKLKKKLEAAGASMELSINPDLPDAEAGYDRTLLAVVGVLDATKGENNVAAWMRTGGLMNVSVTSTTDVTATAVETPTKRRRLSAESGDEGTVRGSSPITSGPPSSDAAAPTGPPSPATSSLSVEEEVAQATTGVPMSETTEGTPTENADTSKATASPPLWFDSEAILDYWARRGVKALEELRIKVEAGIIGTSG